MSGENRQISIRSQAVLASDGTYQNAVKMETIIREDEGANVVGSFSDSGRQFDNSQSFDNVSLSSDAPEQQNNNNTEQEVKTKQEQITPMPLPPNDHKLHVDNFNFNDSQHNNLSGRQINSLLNSVTMQNPGQQDKFSFKPPRFNYKARHINDAQQNMPGVNLAGMLPAQNNYPGLFDDACDCQQEIMYPGHQLQNVDMGQLYHDPGMRQAINYNNLRRQLIDSSHNMPSYYNSPGQPLEEYYMMQQPTQMLPVGMQMELYDGQSQAQMYCRQDQMQMLYHMQNDVRRYQSLTQSNVGQNGGQLLFDARNRRPAGEVDHTLLNYFRGQNTNSMQQQCTMQSDMTYNQQMRLEANQAVQQYYLQNRVSSTQIQTQIRPGEQNIMQALKNDQAQRFVGKQNSTTFNSNVKRIQTQMLSTGRQKKSKIAGQNQLSIGWQHQTQMPYKNLMKKTTAERNQTESDCEDWLPGIFKAIHDYIPKKLNAEWLKQQSTAPFARTAPFALFMFKLEDVTKALNQSTAQKGSQKDASDLSKLKD